MSLAGAPLVSRLTAETKQPSSINAPIDEGGELIAKDHARGIGVAWERSRNTSVTGARVWVTDDCKCIGGALPSSAVNGRSTDKHHHSSGGGRCHGGSIDRLSAESRGRVMMGW